jgi:hypothetical protein
MGIARLRTDFEVAKRMVLCSKCRKRYLFLDPNENPKRALCFECADEKEKKNARTYSTMDAKDVEECSVCGCYDEKDHVHSINKKTKICEFCLRAKERINYIILTKEEIDQGMNASLNSIIIILFNEKKLDKRQKELLKMVIARYKGYLKNHPIQNI